MDLGSIPRNAGICALIGLSLIVASKLMSLSMLEPSRRG